MPSGTERRRELAEKSKVPFTKLYTIVVDEMLRNSKPEPHIKLFLLALTTAQPNGHANFKPRFLAKQVGGKKPHRDIAAVIARAVKCGLLDPKSSARCLVLPKLNTGEPWGVQPLIRPHDKTIAGNAEFWSCKICDGADVIQNPSSCHEDREHYAKGLCKPCYQAKWHAENPKPHRKDS